jgi:hypothetical protein
MSKQRMGILMVLAMLMATVVAVTIPSGALADTGNCNTASNGVTYCNSQSSVTSQESDVKVEKLNLDSSGVLQVRWEFPKGWRPKSLKGCHWVTGGTNSFRDSSGHLVKVSWAGKRAFICPSKSSPSGWRKAGGPPTFRNCGNIFWPPRRHPKHIFRGRFKVVQHFTFTAKLTLKMTLTGTVTATATCSVNGASASGTASGSDEESIIVTATATGSSFEQASGEAHSIAVHSQAVNNLKATVTATATFKMEASASASCQASPPPPPPPVLPSVSITNFTNLNLTAAGKTSGPAPFSVNASDPGTVTVNADLGGVSDCNSSTPQPSVTFALVAGNNNECVIYYAPNDADKPPSDTITYTAIVTTAGGTAKDVKTDTVDIQYPVRP